MDIRHKSSDAAFCARCSLLKGVEKGIFWDNIVLLGGQSCPVELLVINDYYAVFQKSRDKVVQKVLPLTT
jgi:hypothetical protein